MKSEKTADVTRSHSARSINQNSEKENEAIVPCEPILKSSNQLELPNIKPRTSKHSRSHSAQLEEAPTTINHSFQTPRAEKQMSVQISEAPEIRPNSQRQDKKSVPFTLRLLNSDAEARKQEERKL